MQPSPLTLKAMYEALMTVAASPDLDEAERIQVTEFALRLVTELAMLKPEGDPLPQPESKAIKPEDEDSPLAVLKLKTETPAPPESPIPKPESDIPAQQEAATPPQNNGEQ